MKLNSSLVRALGAVVALALPAVVVAQTFETNRPLTAAALNGLVGRIAALENDNIVGNIVELLPVPTTTDGTLEPVSFRSRADGIINLVPGGNSVQSAFTIVRTNVGGTLVPLVRIRQDNSGSFPVRNGQTFTVEATSGGSLDVHVYFTPIRGNDTF